MATDTTPSSAVAAEVRGELARTRKTAAALADEISMTRATLSRRLSGASPFTLDELALIAPALGTTVHELVSSALSRRPAA